MLQDTMQMYSYTIFSISSFITNNSVLLYFSISILFTCLHIMLCLINCARKKVKTTIPDAAPAQPAAVSQENKDEVKEKGKNDEQKNKEKTKTEGEKEKEKKDEEKKDEEKKDEEKTDKERKDEGKKDEEKKDEEKSKEKKRNDLEEAKAKDDRETEKRDKKDSEVKEVEIKKVEDKKEEDLKKDAENPIVTPVSDEDEITAQQTQASGL
uniref:Uncharacterized protein n=1 Tax=Onchocerca volvulus TaxID=6282 RepID=A0A8R1Y2A4_ONCVO